MNLAHFLTADIGGLSATSPALLERLDDTVFRVVPEPDASSPAPSPVTLDRWFATLFQIQRLAACSPEFTLAAVQALVDPGGLEVGIWLTRQRDGWQIESRFTSGQNESNVTFDVTLADMAVARRETVLRTLPGGQGDAESCMAQLASPVFNEQNEGIGVLAGIRHQAGSNRRRSIRSLDARWIQLLAACLTSGRIRQQQEIEASRQRILLEQAFPREIAQRLVTQPFAELAAERREITVMFVDMRGSSQLSESLSPDVTYRLLTDVMDLLTRVVMSYCGVVVDYYGDGLIAMWNAPLDQASHAQMACHAGLQILSQLHVLNARWQIDLQRPIRLGIGIHTGTALVGNSGSRQRIKYGPRGICVNIASRIERVTRLWPYPILISADTRSRLAADAVTQRLGKVKLWGIEQAVELHALHLPHAGDCTACARLVGYDEVLHLVERGEVADAQQRLSRLSESEFDEIELRVLRQQIALMQTWRTELRSGLVADRELVVDLTQATTSSIVS